MTTYRYIQPVTPYKCKNIGDQSKNEKIVFVDFNLNSRMKCFCMHRVKYKSDWFYCARSRSLTQIRLFICGENWVLETICHGRSTCQCQTGWKYRISQNQTRGMWIIPEPSCPMKTKYSVIHGTTIICSYTWHHNGHIRNLNLWTLWLSLFYHGATQ